MLALILGFAEKDDRIRVVLMNGSRVNPSAKKDIFRDYDILNLVTDVQPFKDARYVTPHFGEAIMIEEPEGMTWPPPPGYGGYNYNMQLADGNRIEPEDLGLRDTGKGELESLRMDYWERRLIKEALTRADNSVPEAAKLLGLGRATLYRKIEEYGIER